MKRDQRLQRLEEHAYAVDEKLNFLISQVAETNLKLRFVCDACKTVRQVNGGLLDPEGKPQVEVRNLNQVWAQEGRAVAMAALEKEIQEQRDFLAAQEQEWLRQQSENHQQQLEAGDVEATRPLQLVPNKTKPRQLYLPLNDDDKGEIH